MVVITGGSSGIGRCTAVLFARRGWHVGLIARGEAGLRAVAADVVTEAAASGVPVATEVADVTDPGALEAAADRLEAALGPADVWVNCAGNGTFGRFLDIPADEFRHVVDVTFLGTVNGTRAALRRMTARNAGHIVNVCSGVAFHGMPLLSSYSGAKHAIRGFDQAIRAELAEDGSRVRLSTVFPPAVNTPFFDRAPSYMGRPGRPIPPVYQPEVVAEAVHLAATGRRGREMAVSFTSVLFALATRLVPGLARRAVHRLGYASQLATDPEAVRRHAPTLVTASKAAFPAHGAYDAVARRRSFQVGLMGWAATWRARLGAFRQRVRTSGDRGRRKPKAEPRAALRG